jgi:hypothetical protein
MAATWVVPPTPAVGGILDLIMAAITVGLVMLVMAATPAAQMGAAVATVDIDEFHHQRFFMRKHRTGTWNRASI